jgi:hypothetical protein
MCACCERVLCCACARGCAVVASPRIATVGYRPGVPFALRCFWRSSSFFVFSATTGTTSILAHALGIAPSKDNYWCATRAQCSVARHTNTPDSHLACLHGT